ncbi:ketopantoate reductase family protein [Selenomonas montiformis]|uniref:ketopantoate reductase family protein n=1 Tax=Selenomonas montiformis TaxID=2652285 RepID=UPI003F8C9FEE
MKFAILGAGGTGGVLGGYLANAGNDVTFIARGKHLSAMQNDGLTIRTNHRGDIHIAPVKACTAADYKETPDVLFICVKYYGIPDAISLAGRIAGSDTLVIPILNVFGTGAVMQEQLPDCTVLDGCIYVFAKIGSPGVIEQPQEILRVFYGFRPGQDRRLTDKATQLETIMRSADIHAHFTEQIQRDALTKFSFVSPMGAAGLYFHVTSEAFQQPGEVRDTFIGLVREVEAVGHAMGIVFDRDLVAADLRLMDAFAPGLTTSMQRDIEKGGPSEFSGLVSRMSELGRIHHVPTPLYDKIAHWGKEHGLA